MNGRRLDNFFRRAGSGSGGSSADNEPQQLSIAFDKLKLVLVNYVQRVEASGTWARYAGLALSFWASVVVSNFDFEQRKFGLTGDQWELVFLLAAIYATVRSVFGFLTYLQRPRLDQLLRDILSHAEITREARAMCLLKFRGTDHEYRILVYRDLLWDCYLLPHYNMADITIQDVDDPALCNFVSGIIGVPAGAVSSNYISNRDLRSRKHSEFHRQGTLYRFSFYAIRFTDPTVIPDHVKLSSFYYHGRTFEWLTISEMEADQNTRNRNLDVTRHLADNATSILVTPPDSLPGDVVKV